MISIAVGFRRSRARDGSKPGVVYFRLVGPRRDGSKGALSFNTPLKGHDEGILQTDRGLIVALIRRVYDEIERLERSGGSVTVDAVVEKVRELMKGPVTESGDSAGALRSDLISVAGQFRDCFTFTRHDLPRSGVGDLLSFTAMKAQQCRQENRICTSRSYGNLQKELMEFCGETVIDWSRVNAGLVREFASWLSEQGYKASTMAYYLGMLRTTLFQARDEGLCQATSEWFRTVRIAAAAKPSAPVGRRLDVEIVRKIAALDLTGREELRMVRDMFLFAFYCRGMELVDVAHLTKDNLHGKTLAYNRRLTGKEIRVPLDAEAKRILDHYDTGRKYLFPLLDTGRSSLFTTRRNIVVMRIKEIGAMVGYPDLTFMRNIDAWKSLVSDIQVSDRLRYYPSGT